jgi:hypothetical protein
MTSTPEKLVELLGSLAAVFPDAAAIAVQFPEYVDFVRAGETGKVVRLRELIDAGGAPVGFVFAEREGRRVEISAVPLPELESEPGIERDLQSIVEYFRALLVQDGRCAAMVGQ